MSSKIRSRWDVEYVVAVVQNLVHKLLSRLVFPVSLGDVAVLDFNPKLHERVHAFQNLENQKQEHSPKVIYAELCRPC